MNSKEFTRYCGFISLVRVFVVVKIFKFCCFAWNYFQPVNMQYAPKICIYIVFTNDNMFERVVSRFILESFKIYWNYHVCLFIQLLYLNLDLHGKKYHRQNINVTWDVIVCHDPDLRSLTYVKVVSSLLWKLFKRALTCIKLSIQFNINHLIKSLNLKKLYD